MSQRSFICLKTGKHSHQSRRKATAQLRSLVELRGEKEEELREFMCHHCKGWHVGHLAERELDIREAASWCRQIALLLSILEDKPCRLTPNAYQSASA